MNNGFQPTTRERNAQSAEKQTHGGIGQGADVLRKRRADERTHEQGGQKAEKQAGGPASQNTDLELAEFPGERQKQDARQSASAQAGYPVRREQYLGERSTHETASNDEERAQNQAQAARSLLFLHRHRLYRHLLDGFTHISFSRDISLK